MHANKQLVIRENWALKCPQIISNIYQYIMYSYITTICHLFHWRNWYF